MKIDLLIGDNAYDTTTHFAKGLARALERQGVDIRLFWIADGHFFHAFYEIMNDPPDLTCSFSDIVLSGRPLNDFWQIPHLSLLVDPPIYFLHQLCKKGSWISCVDQYDCSFVKALDFQNVFFLPHGVDQELITPVTKERPFDVVFFGTCIDYEKIAQKWPKSIQKLLLEASRRVLSPDGISIAQALIELEVSNDDFARFHGEVDSYTRGKDRVELIKSLKGHNIHIWGNGPWDKYLTGCSIHPSVSFAKTVEIMQESKVILNSSPRFKRGSHERIFYAHMCGAAVYTGQTSYLQSELPELFTYHFGQWENKTFDQWEACAIKGQERVISNHTWDVRANALIDAIK